MQSRLFQKFLLEILILVVGISLSFWINNLQNEITNRSEEQQLLQSIARNLEEIKLHIRQRKETFEDENHLMDYISAHWGNIKMDSIVTVLRQGTFKKSFHNLFLDYREFHPPMAEIQSLIADGSIALIRNTAIKVALINLIDSELDFVSQNVASEIDLQQAFRATLLKNASPELIRALRTSQNEMQQRLVQSDLGYDNKIVKELEAILQQPEAEVYLNLKIRQRFFVMLFLERFEEAVDTTAKRINNELNRVG